MVSEFFFKLLVFFFYLSSLRDEGYLISMVVSMKYMVSSLERILLLLYTDSASFALFFQRSFFFF